MFFFKKSKTIENIPKNVAIIMDGNSRWAAKRGLSKKMGHRAGLQRIDEIMQYANQVGIKSLTLYAFSTENWNRDQEEINYLFNLVLEFEEKQFSKLLNAQIRFKMIGDISRIPEKAKEAIIRMEKATCQFQDVTLYIALNYGGQDEIIRACQKIQKQKQDITINTINQNLDTDYHKIDLLIRTSGEQRISNFLIWQNSYAEFVFTNKLWPDFNQKEFKKCLKEYEKRNRRFGGR